MRGPAAMARRTSDRDRAPAASGAPTTPTGMAVQPAAASGRFEVEGAGTAPWSLPVGDMSILARLQVWYASQCDGNWEHSSGIVIQSCDNPGWWVKVGLLGTSLVGREFPEVADGVDSRRFPIGSRWLCCRIEDDTWHGAGDETKLEHILETFLAWAEPATD